MSERPPLAVKLFKEEGFVRKACSVCGSPFWTLDEDRETCGDQPCDDYNFIGSPAGRRYSSIRELRESFLRFFEARGHARVKRYPVVARWRDDVYLVGASIYDFQPWVTEGIVPPPANPLVISQPCIRLTDVDNVGKTGRHMTNFEMMAHHAFNIGCEVYWIDETVEYAYRFLTEEVGVPREEVTFKEDWWSGGGNAGEDFEVLVRGLEVATLVFMHYRVVDDEVIPMENRIIDTGYGLERLYWLVTGAPTVYDAVFGDMVNRLRRAAGIPPVDERVFASLSRYMGKLDAKKPESFVKAKSMIASRLGMAVEDLDRMIRPYEAIYAVLDHSRALMFMIGDGVVPSSSGSGYLARLLIRRAIRSLMQLGSPMSLVDVVDMQVRRWAADFPEYEEVRDSLLDIVEHEERRYARTLEVGRKVVGRVVRRLRSRGVAEMPLDELITLYDSHGLAPEYVKELAEAEGVRVSVPADFYSKLAELHERRARAPKAAKALEEELRDKLRGLRPTRLLFYEDPYRMEFDAEVVAVVDGKYVVLDRTCFYPEGGGQPSDTGALVHDGVSVAVRDVRKVGNVVVHVCDPCDLRPGDRVRGVVDRVRRLALMRNHTATHIILAAARRVLGKHVWQAGAQKGVERSRLDITHYKRITREELDEIERLANTVVLENRPVRARFMRRNDAERAYGFTLYQGGVVPGPEIRVVEVEGWDAEACGGLHVASTGEVGLIKIVRTERIQDGVERLEFSVGEAALEYVKGLERTLASVCATLGADPETVRDKVKRLVEENRELRERAERLLELKERAEAELLLRDSVRVGEVLLVAGLLDEGDLESLMRLGIRVVKERPDAVAALVSRSERALAILVGKAALGSGVDARELGNALLARLGGKGGGRSHMFNGVVDRVPERDELVAVLQRALKG